MSIAIAPNASTSTTAIDVLHAATQHLALQGVTVTSLPSSSDLQKGCAQFTTKAEYFAWRAAWRALYRQYTASIRAEKAIRSKPHTPDSGRTQSRLSTMRRQAQALLIMRLESKKLAATYSAVERATKRQAAAA